MTAITDRGSEVARGYAPMSKALTGICAGYSDAELARIVEFLEKAADAGSDAASQVRQSAP
ncbi:MAG TPA: hypothetical protein VJ858_02270 [Acidimicrobiia bacterium]|nr:hypothetical protein [Acidimicrobiia bacterium]